MSDEIKSVDKIEEEKKNKIIFVDKILDNVHGFISYTEAEKTIMEMMVFKRLKSIKQLSLVNWIFPGSEHTRFIHSIGVMHVSDKIAIQLGLDEKERKIIRLAGLLHDIGHYPLSHVGELPYKFKLEKDDENSFCEVTNNRIKDKIDEYKEKIEKEFMKPSKQGHHEAIGAEIIKHNEKIKAIIVKECGEDAIEIICDMITGNLDRAEGKNSLMIQILHSELDADGIDYMLRDGLFSGTSFGSFEVEMLIKSMVKEEYEGYEVLCINPKGIAAADQYLINKFFSFSQIVFNKHTVCLEWMAERIISWLIKCKIDFPERDTLVNEWVVSKEDKYLEFTDTLFWSSVREIASGKYAEAFPAYIKELAKKLINHEELKFVESEEYKIIAKDAKEITDLLKSSEMYKNDEFNEKNITILSERKISKHVPKEKFIENLASTGAAETEQEQEDDKDQKEHFEETKQKALAKRLVEGICVFDENPKSGEKIRLLCDDDRSLMRSLYGMNFVVMRSYEFDTKEKDSE